MALSIVRSARVTKVPCDGCIVGRTVASALCCVLVGREDKEQRSVLRDHAVTQLEVITEGYRWGIPLRDIP